NEPTFWKWGIIEGLHTITVSGQHQGPRRVIPDCHCKHTIELWEQLIAPLFPAVDEYLCTRGISNKVMSAPLQISTEYLVVIDLAVENEVYPSILVVHRLMPPGEVDDSQTAEGQADV